MTLRVLALFSTDRAEARSLLEEAVDCARFAGELSFALSYLTRVCEWQGDLVEAYERCTQAVAAAHASGDATAQAEALLRLVVPLVARAEYQPACLALHEALQLSRAIGYRYYVSVIHWQLAWLALAQGDLTVARAWVRSSIETARESGTGFVGLRPLQLAARLAIANGQVGRGARWLAAVSGWQLRLQMRPDSNLWTHWTQPGDEAALDAALDSARTSLGEEDFHTIWASGLQLSLEEALEEALMAVAESPPQPAAD